MGAIAEGFAAFAQPLLDQTDGSMEQVQRAFTISQFCYSLALLPEDQRERSLSELRIDLEMHDEEFSEFRRTIFDPMVRRHQEMFPFMHGRISSSDLLERVSSLRAQPRIVDRVEINSKPDRYAPCPCNSGRKYKFCCGAKGR